LAVRSDSNGCNFGSRLYISAIIGAYAGTIATEINSWIQKVITMVEFTSEPPQKTFLPLTLGIALGILALALGGIVIYVRHQKQLPAQAGSTSVTVPGLLRPGNTNFDYYKQKVKIENVKAILGISFNKARIAMISGTILNDGDRRLEAVEMHITLYDVWGKVSKERTAFALRPGTGLSGKPMDPLERRAFSIGVESVEYYWNPKQITYEITGLKYRGTNE
jgi:hypothetical protein